MREGGCRFWDYAAGPAGYSSRPKDSATDEKFLYDSRYCLPFGVITKAFLPSNSILLISPAPVRLSTNFDSLECGTLALDSSMVVLMPSIPDCSVAVSRSATIFMLLLWGAMPTVRSIRI